MTSAKWNYFFLALILRSLHLHWYKVFHMIINLALYFSMEIVLRNISTVFLGMKSSDYEEYFQCFYQYKKILKWICARDWQAKWSEFRLFFSQNCLKFERIPLISMESLLKLRNLPQRTSRNVEHKQYLTIRVKLDSILRKWFHNNIETDQWISIEFAISRIFAGMCMKLVLRFRIDLWQ